MEASQTITVPRSPPDMPAGLRFKVGLMLFALCVVPYGLLLPLIFYQLPAKSLGTLVAVGMILQKALLVGAVLLLGKAGFATIKAKLFHKLTPPAEVGPLRYRIGLILFCLPFLQSLIETVFSHVAPQWVANRLWVDVLMEAVLVVSVFVLGGNFWDKLRALFVAEARAVFPGDPDAARAAPSAGSRVNEVVDVG